MHSGWTSGEPAKRWWHLLEVSLRPVRTNQRVSSGVPGAERLADAALVCRGRSGRRRMSEVSRRRRSSRSRFDAAGHQGPALEPQLGILTRCQSRSRTRAASASLAKAEAMAALMAYAAAPRSWAATWATATACPAARAANFAESGSPRAAAFATKAARCASRMRTSPRIQERPMSIASRGRVSRGCSCSKRCRTCSAQRAAHSASSRWCWSVNVPPRRMVISRGSRSAGRIGMSSFFVVIPVRSPHQVPHGAPPAGPDRPSGGNELDGRAGSCADSQVTSDLHT